MYIREITDITERAAIMDEMCFEQSNMETLDKIFATPSPQYGDVYFFLDQDGTYHTVIERDDITTRNFEEFKLWLAERIKMPHLHQPWLTKILKSYCEKHGLEHRSADEMLFDHIDEPLSPHAKWFARFIDIWNQNEEGQSC